MKYIPTLGLTFLYQPPGQETFYAINKQGLPRANSGTLAQVVYSCFGDKKERERRHCTGQENLIGEHSSRRSTTEPFFYTWEGSPRGNRPAPYFAGSFGGLVPLARPYYAHNKVTPTRCFHCRQVGNHIRECPVLGQVVNYNLYFLFTSHQLDVQ